MLGINLFALLVITPAMRKVDDHVLTMAMGSIHDRAASRMPAVFAITAGATVAGLALGADPWLPGCGLALLVGWLVLLVRAVLPLNDKLREAFQRDAVLPDVRAVQGRGDRLIYPRLTLLAGACGCLLASLH